MMNRALIAAQVICPEHGEKRVDRVQSLAMFFHDHAHWKCRWGACHPTSTLASTSIQMHTEAADRAMNRIKITEILSGHATQAVPHIPSHQRAVAPRDAVYQTEGPRSSRCHHSIILTWNACQGCNEDGTLTSLQGGVARVQKTE